MVLLLGGQHRFEGITSLEREVFHQCFPVATSLNEKLKQNITADVKMAVEVEYHKTAVAIKYEKEKGSSSMVS